jgi:hypothetical protein
MFGMIFVLISAGCLTRDAVAQGSSLTYGDLVAQGKLTGYRVTITATATEGAPGRLLVVVTSGDPAVDAQTHTYAFQLPDRGVLVKGNLGRARVRADLGSFGSIKLAGAPKGKPGSVSPPAGCTGPTPLVRRMRVRGKIRLELPGIGTVRSVEPRGSAARRGQVTCADVSPCAPTVGARLVGINVAGTFLSVAAVPGGTPSLFASIASAVSPPASSIVHTRAIAGGVLLQTAPPDGTGSVLVTLGADGTHGAAGQLTFAGQSVASDHPSCPGHRVNAIVGGVSGSITLQIAGAQDVGVTGDGAPSSPVGTFREEVD